MRPLFALLVTALCLCAAGDPRALSEANAALALARDGKYESAIAHYRQLQEHLEELSQINAELLRREENLGHD